MKNSYDKGKQTNFLIRHKKDKFLILFILLILFSVISIFLHSNRIQKEQTRLAESITSLTLIYQSGLHSYHLAMDDFFTNTLNQPEVTKLLAEALAASDKEKEILRQRLYQHLLPTYNRMQQQKLSQMQFHLPDGTSFLRFNQPDVFGDNLFGFRSMVRIANQEQRVVYGFEVGVATAGIRFIYPLHYKMEHVGSVEVVLSTEGMREVLSHLDSTRKYVFLLSRSLAEKVFVPEQLALCEPSEINPDFLVYESSDKYYPNSPTHSPTIQRINEVLHNRSDISVMMNEGAALAQAVDIQGAMTHIVSFLPLKDADNHHAGYLVAYTQDQILPAYAKEFYTYLFAVLVTTTFVTFLLCRIRQQAQDLDLERQSLVTINNTLAEGVYVTDVSGIITRTNNAAYEILGYTSEEMLGQLAHDLFHNHEKNNYLPRTQCVLFRHSSQGYGYDGEEIFQCKGGQFVTVEVASRPLYQDNVFVGSVVAFRDIGERKRIEEALLASQEQERRLSAVVQQGPDSVLITDLSGHIEYVNPKFEELTGYSLDEARGKKPPELLATDKISKGVHKNLQATIATQKMWKGDMLNRRKDGTKFWATVSIAPIYGQAGVITHYVAILEDITERLYMEQSLLESELLQRTITESLPVGLVIIDAETRVIEQVNPKAAVMFGTLEEVIVGHRCHKFLCPADQNQCPIGDLHQTVDNSDRILLRQDGTELPILKTVTTVTLQGKPKYLECFVDIVDRKAAEDALLEANQQLEQAIARAEQLAHEAQEANEAKSTFLANMSHEIRTPMNAIIGMTHLALRTTLTAEQQDYLNKVDFAAKSLLGILNDILDFSKIEAGRIDLEHIEFSLSDVLENVASVVTIPTTKTRLELVLDVAQDVPEYLVGDPLRLGQILINLAGNAAKFTEQGEIRISISVAEILDDEKIFLSFQVLDTGIGMDEAQLGKLFDPFEQAEISTTRRYGGTGLGLSISSRLVTLIGGTLTASSVLDQGSIFSFQGIFGLTTRPTSCVLSAHLQGKQAVIFDGLPSSRRILLAMCQGMGLIAREYPSLDEALGVVHKEDVDLVLIAWYQEQITALDVWHSIQTKENPPKVILLVPAHQAHIMRQADQAGFDKIITKPVVRRRLLATIAACLDKEVDQPSPTNHNSELQTFAGGRVLLVEDNVINQQVARTILESAGLTVLVAADGMEAVAIAENKSVDLIFMDLQMPRMDGYEATRQIRSHDHLKDLPIVAMTAHALSSVREEVLAVGMTDCLTKPIDVPELLSMLSKWLPVTQGKLSFTAPDPSFSCTVTDDTPILVVDEGIARFMGDKEEYLQSLAEVSRIYQNSIISFLQQFDAGQFDEVRLFVHTSRGVAGNIGAHALNLAAATLEKELRKHGQELDYSYVEAFCVQLQCLLDEIVSILPSQQKSVKSQKSSEDLIQILDTMLPCLAARKPKNCKNLLKDLRALSLSADIEGEVENLAALIQTYNFTTAFNVVTKLRNSLNKMEKP